MLHEEPYDYYRYTVYGLDHMLKRAGLRPLRIDPAGGAWRLLGQTLLNHKSFGRKIRIPLVSDGILRATVLVVNVACTLLDGANMNVKDTVNYQLVAKKE
jgi:hypothetical protein